MPAWLHCKSNQPQLLRFWRRKEDGEEPSDSSQALLVSELQSREPPARAFLFSSYQKDARPEAGRIASGFLPGPGGVCATEPAPLWKRRKDASCLMQKPFC